MTLEEIKAELQSILEKLASDEEMTEEEVQELEDKAEALEEEKRSLVAKAEKRSATLERVANAVDVEVVEETTEVREEKNMDKEYRSAYFKRLLGRELTEEETRAFAKSGVAGAIPTETSDEILRKITKVAPMLDEITLLNVKGNVSFAVEGTKNAAGLHTENAAITGDADTLVTVTLGGYEITKLVQVSKSVETMTVDAFENWLTDMIAEMVGEKIEDLIINGTGSSQPSGIDKANTWDTTNSVSVAKTGSLTADNVRALIALLPAGYDRNAKILMNKKTLFNSFMGLQDNAKHDLVRESDGKFYVYGYEVLISDKVADNVAFLGDFKKYVANLSSEVEIVSQFDINTNSNKYLGCAIFDGKPAVADAFVKLDKATV